MPNIAANDNRTRDLIDSLRSTLTNIDAEYEFELRKARSTIRGGHRDVVLETLRRRHQERRLPYVTNIEQLRRSVS